MADPASNEVTRLLHRIGDQRIPSGERSAGTDRLLELVYGELRRIASRFMSRERADHTLQPTALVHEAYIRLIGGADLAWNDRVHFLSTAARAMRRILIDHARRRDAEKRGGGGQRVTLEDDIMLGPDPDLELLDLHRVLDKLAGQDGRAARVVEMRVFGGMTVKEVAHALGVSERTTTDDWAMARLWLARELSGASE
jgi:RNA polymerase sigma factor (TIGR02999 family)